MSTLQFHSYSFASLPSGVYLFFPALGGKASASARADAEEQPPARVVVSTAYGSRGGDGFSGISAGSTLYVDVDSSDFEALLKSVSGRERNLRTRPVLFEFRVDAEEGVTQLAIDERRLGAYDPSKSGIPPAKSA